MRQQIVRLSVRQTSKVLAVMYTAMGVFLMPVFVLSFMNRTPEDVGPGLGFALFLPLMYGALGFVFTALGCALYNVVARYVGGIEVEVAERSLGRSTID